MYVRNQKNKKQQLHLTTTIPYGPPSLTVMDNTLPPPCNVDYSNRRKGVLKAPIGFEL